MANILDVIKRVVSRVPKYRTSSNQKNIVRYHTTSPFNVAEILDKGIRPMVGERQMKFLRPEQMERSVFVTADPNLYPPSNLYNVRMKLEIPKGEYVRMEKLENKEVSGVPYGHEAYKKLFTVQQRNLVPGARTEVYGNTIDPRFIKELCVGDGPRFETNCYDVPSYMKKYWRDFDYYEKKKKGRL